MFQNNKTGEIETFTSHFVFSLGLSRFLQLLFWLSSYRELAMVKSGVSGASAYFNVGTLILLSQMIQLLLMANYIYYYILKY